MKHRLVTEYTFATGKVTRPVTLAVVADLHNAPFEDVLPQLEKADAVIVPGDLINRHCLGLENAQRFITTVPALRPVFYSLGNHERLHAEREQWMDRVRASRVTLLDNATCQFGELSLGGVSSVPSRQSIHEGVIDELGQMPGFRLLLCHHPEYYPRAVRGASVDLTVAGHAHGGQVQILGRGLYAPGQGLFPQYTHGIYEKGRLLVSRGMTNSVNAPRLWDPCELVMLRIVPLAEIS